MFIPGYSFILDFPPGTSFGNLISSMANWQRLRPLLSDIRFWIILFFVVRLININAPIFESHNWRQADGYAISRNFLEIELDLFHPRVDHAGDLSGITGSEFPLMNFLVYCLYLLFDPNWWQGRLVSLIVSSIGCWFFFRTIKEFFSEKVAFPATILLLSSIWLAHSRKFMPDVFSTSLILIAVYYGWSYLKKGKGAFHLILFGLFALLGLLSKLPAVVMTGLLFPALLDKSIPTGKKAIVAGISVLAVVPVLIWYFHWVPYLNTEFGFNYFFMGSSISENLQYLGSNLWPTLERFIYGIHFVGFALFLGGIFLASKNREANLLIAFGAMSLLQLAILVKSGEKFTHHTYYIVPFVPAMALMGAYAISKIKVQRWWWVVVAVVMIEGATNEQHEFQIKDKYRYKLRLEAVADAHTKRSELVATNNDQNPSALYFTHRKGWVISTQNQEGPDFFKGLVEKGCALIIWDKHRGPRPEAIPHFTFLEEDEDFALFLPES